MPEQRTRGQRRVEEIDISPTKLLGDIETLKGELDEARKGSDEYLTALQRERAEFQNFRRRTTEERERDAGLAGEDLLRKVLTVADDDSIDQPALNRVAGLLNERLADKTAVQAEATVERFRADDRLEALARRIGERVARIVKDYDGEAIEEVFSDGLLNVMDAPEFAQSDKLRRVFSALENRAYLGQLVGDVAEAGRIRIFIGHENQPIEMRDVSLVLAPYGRAGQAIGVVGVLGPTRMSYSQAIGTVRFVSSLMNELVDHLYA